LRERLAPFVARRLRASLQEHVESAWLALGGPACVERASDLEDAQTFFDQLATLEEAGSLADPSALEEHLGELYAAPDLSRASRVQLMTIHKAKGLEFSTVIVPGLDRQPRAADRPLFAWKGRADGSIMMAPVRRTGEKTEPAYDYLRSLERAADGHELERLFYVAATRARRRLHLLGYARMQSDKHPPQVNTPPWNSLLNKAWSAAHPHFLAAAAAGPLPPAREDEAEPDRGILRTLADRAFEIAVPGPAVPPPPARRDSGSIEFSWAGETARHVGTITHRWLQRIAADGLEQWTPARVDALEGSVRRALARGAIPPEDLEAAVRKVLRALKQAIEEERGRWILGPHPEARTEYRLRVAGPEGVRGAVIDRFFREPDGTLWVVDYKTSTHEGAGVEAFLDSERERYAEQLRGYANALAGRGRVRLGLYFPLLGGWRELAE
jgi:ATP-dependent exoDNAse (exonuclease V) beta subunit